MSDAIELAIAMADTENGIVEETWELTNDLNDLYSKYFFATSLLVNLFILFITENPCFTDIYVIILLWNWTHTVLWTLHTSGRGNRTGNLTPAAKQQYFSNIHSG